MLPHVIPRLSLLLLLTYAAFAESNGLLATYFDEINFSGTSVQRVDPQLDFDWGNKSPAAGIAPDTFSVVWSGQIVAPSSGIYAITTVSDDGIVVWLDRKILISNWSDHSATRNSANVYLEAGRRYEIVVRYYENGGDAVARLLWRPPGGIEAPIPNEALFAVAPAAEALPAGSGSGLRVTYFDAEDFTTPVGTRVEPRLDANWGKSAPLPGMQAGHWSALWRGRLVVPVTDTYAFATLASGQFALWIDGQIVVDRMTGGPGSGEAVTLIAGRTYEIVAKFIQGKPVSARVNLWWSSPRIPPEIVPTQWLYPVDEDATPLLIRTPAASRVSPAWISGSVHRDETVSVLVDGHPAPTERAGANRWFVGGEGLAGIPLTPGTVHDVVVSTERAVDAHHVSWLATDLADTYGFDALSIRAGESLLVTCSGEGERLELDSGQHAGDEFIADWHGSPGEQRIVGYPAAGTYILRARIDDVAVAALTVNVVAVDFLGPTACQIGYRRSKKIAASHPALLTFVGSEPTSLVVDVSAPATLRVLPVGGGDYAIEAHLDGIWGPLVARQVVDEFTIRTTAERVAFVDEIFSDGSLLASATMFLTPRVPELSVRMRVFVSGVTFDDATTTRTVSTNVFALDQSSSVRRSSYTYGLIRSPGTRSGYCHDYVVFQSSVQVSR